MKGICKLENELNREYAIELSELISDNPKMREPCKCYNKEIPAEYS